MIKETKQDNGFLYTYFRVDIEDWSYDWDYAICENLSQVNKIIKMAECDLDDPDRKTKVTITGVAMTKNEYREFKKTYEKHE